MSSFKLVIKKFLVDDDLPCFAVYFIKSIEPRKGYWYCNASTYADAKYFLQDTARYNLEYLIERHNVWKDEHSASGRAEIDVLKQSPEQELRGFLGPSAAQIDYTDYDHFDDEHFDYYDE